MAFKSADRFNHCITLPFGPGRSYRIQSPPIEVGNFVVESTQAVGQLPILAKRLEELEGNDDPAALAEAAEITDTIAAFRDKLTIPKEMEAEYFDGLLGKAYQEMKANREPYELVKLAAATVSIWILSGLEQAEEFWNDGGRHPRKAPQDRKAKRGKGTSK